MIIDNKIVVFGMSCSGKTTFAYTLKDHKYYCFDALFPLNEIETLGLSTSSYLNNIKNICIDDKFVIDGWHLSDSIGMFLPIESSVYVLYSDYYDIISRYRVPVSYPDVHLSMFRKWYDIEYNKLPNIKFIYNKNNIFKQEDYFHYKQTVKHELKYNR